MTDSLWHASAPGVAASGVPDFCGGGGGGFFGGGGREGGTSSVFGDVGNIGNVFKNVMEYLPGVG